MYESNLNPNKEVPVVSEPATEMPQAVPVSEGEKPTGIAAAKTFLSRFSKKTLITVSCLVLALVIIVGAAAGILSYATNNYKTPLRNLEKSVNMKNFRLEKQLTLLTNGLLEKELNAFLKAVKKSSEFEYALERTEESYERFYEHRCDTYGEDWKISLVVEGKEKLERSDLREFRDELRDYADDFLEKLEETDDYDSDDWKDGADELGMSKSEVKALAKAMKKYYTALKDVEITAGYELEVLYSINGEYLDEPEETEKTIRVYKVNGRWVTGESITQAISLIID